MLARKEPETSTNASPFQFKGLAQPQQVKSQQPNTQPVPENNRERTFRRAGNLCEIVAGASLNSAVIFTFHLLQVHPVGLLLALGVAHLYFTATAAGEKGRQLTNVMTGCSASLALLCSLSEPVGEWLEASTSKSVAQREIQQMYAPPTNKSNWTTGVGIAVVIAVLVIYITSGSRGRR
ncbi:hypothetical protein VF14_18720 [Nostoc linckia z18]|jgi:hypothetical protein|uniref:Uncharacterized protein n=2 Tax=Nostoc linckia TaxID=92942 RepID=A0A9Q6EKZ6_NOSLI|nr:hypothetical protein [Nostoc linckia]PHK41536.1 hypothetical protein VF12_06100 [Nostoc linckia z15]PHK45117.1 hypothetical protein VF13_17955 [Nostoc linckia z16]PHJ58467.1 hypothetical protein VF02_27440 [Nostoc linckia z1]PHJ60734.1 hypothetical protein VF05_29850 [Nostoc linckia z3]PHJ65753.1 hypothetical protein VF03_27350 [Nostoc linckia z2]